MMICSDQAIIRVKDVINSQLLQYPSYVTLHRILYCQPAIELLS